jgi:uncharacterized protein
LLAPPLGENFLAIDPGFRSGCKIVCLDEKRLIYNETIYPHAPQTTYGHEKIKSMVNAYNIDAISMETERLRAKPSSLSRKLL